MSFGPSSDPVPHTTPDAPNAEQLRQLRTSFLGALQVRVTAALPEDLLAGLIAEQVALVADLLVENADSITKAIADRVAGRHTASFESGVAQLMDAVAKVTVGAIAARAPAWAWEVLRERAH